MLRIVAIAAGLLCAAVALRAEDEPPPAINWDDAEQHVGEDVTVKGRVVGVHCSPTSCLLAFEPTFNRFTAVVQAERFDLFPPARLDDLFSGRRVQVHGTIVQNDKKPEIVVSNPGDLKLAAERHQERQEQEGNAQQQADVLERLTAVLDQLVALTERMAATQERSEAVLAQIEQRAGMLAAAQPQAPPPLSLGEPQPRPGYEALRTIKRGMKPGDVERLIGKPAYVEYGAGGWSTWYYGFGRSVSFDARGRAQGMVGFPNP